MKSTGLNIHSAEYKMAIFHQPLNCSFNLPLIIRKTIERLDLISSFCDHVADERHSSIQSLNVEGKHAAQESDETYKCD